MLRRSRDPDPAARAGRARRRHHHANQFELGFLTGTEPDTIESTLDAVDTARAMGPRTVLVTSVERPDREEGTIEMLVADDSGAWIVQTPLLPMKANGSGDVTAALFTAHYVRTKDAAAALARTASSVFGLLARTHESGERELQLVESQELYAHPPLEFDVRQVR
jgi:Pyridoxal kinase (EC 2.7.1.35)